MTTIVDNCFDEPVTILPETQSTDPFAASSADGWVSAGLSRRAADRLDADALQALVEDNADGIVLVDHDGLVRYANRAAFALFEASGRGDLIDQPFGIPLVVGDKTELDIPTRHGLRVVEMRVSASRWRANRAFLVSLRDITDRKTTEQDLREARDHARVTTQAALVLDQVGDGIFLVSRKGVIEFWNPAAEQITGLSPADVQGKAVDDMLPGWVDLVQRVPISTTPGVGDRRLAIAPLEIADQKIWLSIAGVRFATGTVYAFRDVTEERRLEALKTDFLATVAHELRTPVTSIYGALETALRDDITLDDAARDVLIATAHEQSVRLCRLINDILTANHIDSGKIHVAADHLDLAAMIQTLLDDFATTIPDDVTVEASVPDEPLVAIGDTIKVQQVLTNLLANAVKYSIDGGRVLIRAQRDGNEIRCEIQDFGIGIPQAHQVRIFEKFYRVDPHMHTGVGGTGLGLYICRELIQRMNGTIGFTSRPDHGSTFWITLPASD